MVEFDTGYVMNMDRDYGASRLDDTGTNDVGIAPIRDVGFSVPLGIAAPNVQGVAAKMRTGTRIMEIQFPGAGRSQRGAQTPGIYGWLQRQALEELSRANNVDFTTHASFSVMGMAGMDQQGNFSKQNKKFAVDEIKRAIAFSADVARGGNVVVHTGEFQRPISEEKWAIDPETGKERFKSFEGEAELATIRVVDKRTGEIAQQVRKNRKVARARWFTAKQGETYFDDDGNEHKADEEVYIDYERKKVKEMKERVPEYDQKSGRFKVDYWNWDNFVEEAKQRTKEAREFWRKHRGNDKEFEKSPYLQFKDALSEDMIIVEPEEAYVQATLETNAGNAKGWAMYYGERFDDHLDKLPKLRKALKLYEKIEAGVDEEDMWKLKQEARTSLPPGLFPPDMKNPTEIIKESIRSVEHGIEQAREGSSSQEQQAEDAYETMRHIVSQRKYALDEAYDSYAQGGLYAMEKSKQIEKQGKLKKPIFVAMEHIFPESYGGHPDELIDLVENSRRKMVAKLKERGYNEQEAKKQAETHIKGHIDTGHLNLWRKYWVHDDKLDPEENDRRYTKWMLGKVEEMAKKQMVGSVHLTDNMGYQDEHLSPGEGTTHVKEMVEILKKNGFKGAMVVEPGADATTDLSDFHGLMKTWRLFGSSVYGVGLGGGSGPGRQQSWGNVQYGYFGQSQPPFYTFGGYSPSEDWTFWSGVPLE